MSTDLLLNQGFGELIGDAAFDETANEGFVGIRQDIPGHNTRDLVQEFVLHDEMTPIFLIGPGKTDRPPGDIARIAGECAGYCHEYKLFERSARPIFEIVNEPNLAPYYEEQPVFYARAVNKALMAIRAYHADALVLAGGVGNTDDYSLSYLERAAAYFMDEVGIGFHSYHTKAPPQKPHKGFPNRHAEMIRLRSIAGDRVLALTELGRHTASQTSGCWPFKKGYRESDEDVARYLEWEIKFFASYDVKLIVVYQYRDGPKGDWSEDRFGIHRMDGTKKQIAFEMPRIAQEIA